MVYEPRTYRTQYREDDLEHFQVRLLETDLDIAVRKGLDLNKLAAKALDCITACRKILDDFSLVSPDFFTTLEPYQPAGDVDPAIAEMCHAARLAGVGPMAAAAGLFAEKSGRLLSHYSKDVIVENGGDIWIKSSRIRKVAIFAGNSPFSCRLAIEVKPYETPLGICTSSGTVGHSLSFGKADAAVILAPSAVLADAVATAMGNLVQTPADLEKAVDFALSVPGVSGALAIIGDKMAAKGRIKIVPL